MVLGNTCIAPAWFDILGNDILGKASLVRVRTGTGVRVRFSFRVRLGASGFRLSFSEVDV